MKYQSNLPYNTYISAMKEQMSSFFNFGAERFTGTIIGGFFSVTYHSGYELNRRITNEKHRAIGFARSNGDGTEIFCIRLAGMTNPLSLLVLFTLFYFISFLLVEFEFSSTTQRLVLNAVVTVITALISALGDSLTARGQEGSIILTAFLIDPTDFYSKVY